jgi:hypothetical protein
MLFEANKQLQCDTTTVKHISFIIERKKTIVYDIFCEYFKRQSFSQYASRNDGLPHEWEATNNKYPLQINLSSSPEEYHKTIRDFYQMISGSQIKSIRIEKIQNERLYRQYQIEKEHLNNVLDRDTERILFHGCPNIKESLESIKKYGLDRSMADTACGNIFLLKVSIYTINDTSCVGTRYGEGVYFSTKSSESHKFTQPDSKTGERSMFVCSVLCGVSILGNPSMNVCPEGYNSTTNGFTIYAVYRDAQVYVGYLVYYKSLGI